MQSGFLKARALLGLAAIVSTLGCSEDSGERLGVARTAIVYGEPSPSDPSVVAIVTRISDVATLSCSGTLIAPDVVLTALHCVTYRENPEARFTCRPDGSIQPGTPGAGSLGLPVSGENVHVYLGSPIGALPDASALRVFGSGSSQICRDDLAVIVLDREIGLDPAAMRFAGRSVSVGESMISVGFGEDEDGLLEGRRLRAVQVLDVGEVGSVDATGPTPPNTFVVGEGPCHGDSGGPTFSAETGAVTGVYSLTLASSCTSIGVRNTYTLVSQFEATIREALEFAGREPIIEEGSGGSAGSGGNAGTGGASPAGEGSGSRDDASCTCRTAGSPAQTAFGWASIGVVAATVLRRRRRALGSCARNPR